MDIKTKRYLRGSAKIAGGVVGLALIAVGINASKKQHKAARNLAKSYAQSGNKPMADFVHANSGPSVTKAVGAGFVGILSGQYLIEGIADIKDTWNGQKPRSEVRAEAEAAERREKYATSKTDVKPPKAQADVVDAEIVVEDKKA